MGLTFLLQTAYLLPLTVVAALIAGGALGFRAGRRRGYRPLVLGSSGAILMIVGKFAFDMAPVTYGGIALLIVASIWNSWPNKNPGAGASSSKSSA